MKNNSHLCVIYIKATSEQVWEALTSPEFTRRYFHQTDIESDWQDGSDVIYYNQDRSIAVKGKVLEVDRPHKLCFTWHVHYDKAAFEEGPTRVTFTLEQVEDTTKLTMLHDDFVDDSVLLPNITEGWIAIMSNLKTLLETGETLGIS
jgi:uncharacterized protein YndB with AHSA1/START domain